MDYVFFVCEPESQNGPVDRFAGERRQLGRAAEEMQLREQKKKTAPAQNAGAVSF